MDKQVNHKKTEPGKNNGLSRDVFMLIIGAIITLLTSVITNYFTDKKEERKDKLSKKLELNRDLSKDIGSRFYLTYDILTRKTTTDSTTILDTATLSREQSELMESRMTWNQNINSYKALLKYYYGNSNLSSFIDSIYVPFIELGRFAENKKMYPKDTAKINTCLRLNANIQIFMQNIYELAYK